jgi:hypothetical protein
MSTPNPYAAPAAAVRDFADAAPADVIARLNVSDAWKQKFMLIAKAGGPKLQNTSELTRGERMKIMFNVLAFLFGPLYLLAKGLWRPALALTAVLLLAMILLDVVLSVAGAPQLGKMLGYGAAAVYAVRANVCYYSKMVLGQKTWF